MKQCEWQTLYRHKLSTTRQAIAAIPRGARVLIGSGAGEPHELVQGLVEHGTHLADNEIVHLLTLGPAPYVEKGIERRFRHTAFFIGPNTRDAVHDGRADFMPVFLSDIPTLIRSRRVGIDVALIQVSPPDAHGYVSLGVSVDIVLAAVDTATLVLAEVNPHMPRTLGASFVHISRLYKLIPVDHPVAELNTNPPDEVSTRIGNYVATLIPDGATLQMGIGNIPDAVLRALGQHKDLGVHTEMFSDGVMHLVEAGVINGKRKTLLPGKVVTSFIMGSKALYDWVHENPVVEMRPSNFTNDPFTIARNETMVAINSALAVDLTGQVAADTLDGRFFSGIGGQVDFIRGAARSRNGRPIIALPSTAKKGTVSRIRATLEEGAGVVTSRGDVRYVVTEYGIADLWGKNIRQRAMALIEIAHPDFRGELLATAKARRYVFPDQVAPRAGYPSEQTAEFTLKEGRRITVRPVRITDEEPLKRLFYGLSDESTYRRFMAFKKAHPHEEMQKLVDVDFDQSMALLVTADVEGLTETIGMARYDADLATRLCDIAFVVRDDWQNRGVGTALLKRMAEVAKQRGYRGFTANVLASNRLMMAVFHKSGLRLITDLDEGMYRLNAYFDEPGLEAARSRD